MTTAVRFTGEDLDAFAAASHDRNPLHLSALYGRRSQFGRQVVYGALGALKVLAQVRPPVGKRLASITLEFARAVFLATDYQVVVNGDTAFLMDGSTRLMKVSVQFVEGAPSSPELAAPAEAPRESAAQLGEQELVAGFTREGQYRPDPAPLYEHFGLDTKAWGTMPLATILWASYLVGMEIPGERALFYRYTAKFEDAGPQTGAFHWQVHLKSRNALNLLRSIFEIQVGNHLAATGQIEALVRPLSVVRQFEFPRTGDLLGKTALVTGASRGFGAALTRALVHRGARVLANFQQSQRDAERLRDELNNASGSVELLQGDASDLAWCAVAKAQYPKLDFLILNACPTVLGMKAEAESVERLNAYVARAFALVSVPLSVLGPSVENRCVLISSIYVETLPKDFPHYVAVKAAAEALFRAVAKQNKAAGYLIVRPPKLLTDMTNTPYGSDDAIAPEELACSIADHLTASAAAGIVTNL